MRAKDKIKSKHTKHIKITIKSLILFFGSILILLYCIIFYHYYFATNVYAMQTSATTQEEFKISQATAISLEELQGIVDGNNQKTQTEEYKVEEAQLEYITTYKENASLPKGTLQVLQEGREGTQEITKKITYENGEVVSEEQVSSIVTKASVNKIVEVGTGSGTNNYSVKVGDIICTTSDRAAIMVEPNENSQKKTTLTKGTRLTVLAITGEWYQVSGSGTNGYIKADSTTHINSGQQETTNNENNTNNTTTTQNRIKELSFDMALNEPSGLTLEQFKKVLTDSKDTNKIFQNNAEYFYYIEEQYNINGLFVAAVGIHESAWGTSKIAQTKYNLFGYGAYDSNPYNGAYEFSNYSECIDLIARVFVKYYLNPKGTSIYGGETALGTYYNGSTLTAVNQKYATDKNWANSVYSHMKYLYNKL